MITEMLVQGRNGFSRIPMIYFAPHEEWAVKNHGQTLQQLAERGGVCWSEAWAILSEVGLFCVDHSHQDLAEAAVRKLLNLPKATP